MNEYLIVGNTTVGIKLEKKIPAENIVKAIDAFVKQMKIEVEGNVNFPFTFTIIKLKKKVENNES
jgi:hypothetical protein